MATGHATKKNPWGVMRHDYFFLSYFSTYLMTKLARTCICFSLLENCHDLPTDNIFDCYWTMIFALIDAL